MFNITPLLKQLSENLVIIFRECRIQGIEQLPQELKEMIPNFKFRAYDYSPPGEEIIKGSPLLQAILWMLKAIREKNFKDFKKAFHLFPAVPENYIYERLKRLTKGR